MTALNRDRVVTYFRKLKDALTKTSLCLETISWTHFRGSQIKSSELKLLDRII